MTASRRNTSSWNAAIRENLWNGTLAAASHWARTVLRVRVAAASGEGIVARGAGERLIGRFERDGRLGDGSGFRVVQGEGAGLIPPTGNLQGFMVTPANPIRSMLL
ncbi:MAG: hypothetical protein HQL91_03955 [Magnetococcales bacterium]|nr:hypothetical protein [Magnetococcales bacterium]